MDRENPGFHIVPLILHDLNRYQNDFIVWASELGNGAKTCLPELPVKWIASGTSQSVTKSYARDSIGTTRVFDNAIAMSSARTGPLSFAAHRKRCSNQIESAVPAAITAQSVA
jgi:hypothetical protein